jgi:hypothetical protein
MQRLITLLSLLIGLALGACRTDPGASDASSAEVAARPEVRYYMISDA